MSKSDVSLTVNDVNAITLSSIVRGELLRLDALGKPPATLRATEVYTAGSAAGHIYFLESGLAKLWKRGERGKEIILKIVAPGELFGEDALDGSSSRTLSAELIRDGVVCAIPRETMIGFCERRPGMWRLLAEFLLSRQRELERKVELLSLYDVEYRILYYLAELSAALNQGKADGEPHTLPLSQSEMASLIGATRETTSTTLNALERRGLVRLGRRLLTVPSPDEVRLAARNLSARAAKSQ